MRLMGLLRMVMWWWWWCSLLLYSSSSCVRASVTYNHKAVIINGQRRILISGSIHYPRSTPEMWPDLIQKAKDGGLDVIQTYVFWNGHEPFKAAMKGFTEKIVGMMKAEQLFETQGGPIIMPQINACNGFYCDLDKRNKPYKPFLWTENWSRWFTGFGTPVPYRPVEDIAFSVGRFIQKGGSFMNYYMFHGRTNFGRTAGSLFIATSYDYDALIDEFGPSWNQRGSLPSFQSNRQEDYTYIHR